MPERGSLGETFRILMDRQGCPLVNERGQPQWIERPLAAPVMVGMMLFLFAAVFVV